MKVTKLGSPYEQTNTKVRPFINKRNVNLWCCLNLEPLFSRWKPRIFVKEI